MSNAILLYIFKSNLLYTGCIGSICIKVDDLVWWFYIK